MCEPIKGTLQSPLIEFRTIRADHDHALSPFGKSGVHRAVEARSEISLSLFFKDMIAQPIDPVSGRATIDPDHELGSASCAKLVGTTEGVAGKPVVKSGGTRSAQSGNEAGFVSPLARESGENDQLGDQGTHWLLRLQL